MLFRSDRNGGVLLQLARPCQPGADIGSAGLHHGQHRRQHGADMDHVADRAGLRQAQQHRAPRQRHVARGQARLAQRPGEAEVMRNPRARSAVLRVAERTEANVVS